MLSACMDASLQKTMFQILVQSWTACTSFKKDNQHPQAYNPFVMLVLPESWLCLVAHDPSLRLLCCCDSKLAAGVTKSHKGSLHRKADLVPAS